MARAMIRSVVLILNGSAFMEPNNNRTTKINKLIASLDKLRERLWNSVYQPDREDVHLIDDTITVLEDIISK